jgi:hypothetical protein
LRVPTRTDDTAKVRVLDIDDSGFTEGGSAETPHPRGRRGVVAALTAIAMMAAVVGLYVATPDRERETASDDLDRAYPVAQVEESSLLHPLGSPVDRVERFISALNYGSAYAVEASLAPVVDRIELPFQRSSRETIVEGIQFFGAIHAVIEVFGCRLTETDDAPSADVICAIAFDSDLVRALGSENLRGVMRFRVSEDGISSITVPHVDLPIVTPSDIDAAFGGVFGRALLAGR